MQIQVRSATHPGELKPKRKSNFYNINTILLRFRSGLFRLLQQILAQSLHTNMPKTYIHSLLLRKGLLGGFHILHINIQKFFTGCCYSAVLEYEYLFVAVLFLQTFCVINVSYTSVMGSLTPLQFFTP